MTIAIEASRIQSSKWLSRLRPIRYLVAVWLRFWWHTKAYVTVFGIMALVLLSILGVFLDQRFGKLLHGSQQRLAKFLSTNYSNSSKLF